MVRLRGLRRAGGQAQGPIMTNFAELASAPCDPVVPVTDQLRLAVAAYLARFQGFLPLPHRVRPPLLSILVQRARPESSPCDFALVAMLGLLGE